MWTLQKAAGEVMNQILSKGWESSVGLKMTRVKWIKRLFPSELPTNKALKLFLIKCYSWNANSINTTGTLWHLDVNSAAPPIDSPGTYKGITDSGVAGISFLINEFIFNYMHHLMISEVHFCTIEPQENCFSTSPKINLIEKSACWKGGTHLQASTWFN